MTLAKKVSLAVLSVVVVTCILTASILFLSKPDKVSAAEMSSTEYYGGKLSEKDDPVALEIYEALKTIDFAAEGKATLSSDAVSQQAKNILKVTIR